MNQIDNLYSFIHDYAVEHKLENTCLAIPVPKQLLAGKIRKNTQFDRDGVLQQTFFDHCLLVTKMLIDLKIPLSQEEEDILLAGTLCHDTIAHCEFPKMGLELIEDYKLNKRVYDIVRLTTKIDVRTNDDLKKFYDDLKTDKLAVLLAMADRGNLVENLHAISIAESLEYIREIRKYCLPMCVYALEHYPDIQIPLKVLMSKVHNLIDVTDIISRKYEEREISYDKEILSVMEENSKLRGMIAQLQQKMG